MYTSTKYCRRFLFDGNEILRYYSSFPNIENNPEINKFYETLSKEYELFCENEEFPRLCKSFRDRDNNPKKLPYQRYSYSFSAEISEHCGDILKICLSIRVCRSKNDIILFFSDEQIWSLNTNLILKPTRTK